MVVLSSEDRMSAPKDRNWPKDEFGRSEVFGQLWWWVIPVIGVVVVIFFQLLNSARARKENRVIVYCAQDRVYAEPVFHDFERQTGLKVRAVYDSEAVKTVGLANRLLAERSHPQCDVFWGNEEMRTRQLAAQNLFRDTNGWSAFGYRSRRIVINTNRLSLASAPHSLIELTNETWRGKVALAYPQFGTTATHFNALRQLWGDQLWQAWCRGMAANKPFLVDGNSVVVKLVGKGEAWVGLTDSDDIADGQREGLAVATCAMSGETLLIANTVAVTRGAPHSGAAQTLFEYLQRRQVVERLVAANALEGFSVAEGPTITMKIDWQKLLNDLESTTAKLNEFFLR
jgi:iron(III) transport system substrate-binding protein